VIDLVKLEEAAYRPGEAATVSRAWLRQAHAELTECRAAADRPRCFGLRRDQQL
jgi:hypothetical protein